MKRSPACKEWEVLLVRERERELPAPERASLVRHLGGCPGCRQLREEYRSAGDLVRQMEALPSPPGLARRAVAEWSAREQSRFSWRQLLTPGPRARMVLGLGLAITAGFGVARIGQERRSTEALRGADRAGGPTTLPSPHSTPGPEAPRLVIRGHDAPTPSPVRYSAPPAPTKRGSPGGSPGGPPPGVGDEAYLDGWDSRVVAGWASGEAQERHFRKWLGRPLPPLRDDFIEIPPPELALGGTAGAAAAGAVREYERQAAAVDARLFRKVSLQLKSASLRELCEALETQTGVQLRAARGVADENVTVLVKERPAREVLRAVARLFAYRWWRTGAEGAYRYELSQDLKSQLAEEERRNQDFHAALVALDERLSAFRRFADLPPDEWTRRTAAAGQAAGEERALLGPLARGKWGGAYLYPRLGPVERGLLTSGQPVEFSSRSPLPERRLPDALRHALLDSTGLFFARGKEPATLQGGPEATLRDRGLQPVSAADWPDSAASVTLRINRSELGEVSLESISGVTIPLDGAEPTIRTPQTVATARSPSVTRPENAVANRKLAEDPQLRRPVELKPDHRCASQETAAGETAHVAAADVWEALHRETGLPIIADAYSRLYPARSVTLPKRPLFQNLCAAADALGVRWQKDGDYVLCRSTSYFWDKLKEVPVTLVRRWTEARKPSGLPLPELLDLARLTDAQLDSAVVGEVLRSCRGISEWGMVGLGPGRPAAAERRRLREYARLLATFSEDQLRRALKPEGIAGEALGPRQREALLALLVQEEPVPANFAGLRIRAGYAPEGTYVWYPVVPTSSRGPEAERWPLVQGPTPQEALAQAVRLNPEAAAADVRRSGGMLMIQISYGESGFLRIGGPDLTVR